MYIKTDFYSERRMKYEIKNIKSNNHLQSISYSNIIEIHLRDSKKFLPKKSRICEFTLPCKFLRTILGLITEIYQMKFFGIIFNDFMTN